jgi:hypothetical protein
MNECPTEDLLSKEGTRILLVRDVATVHPHRREVMERAEVKKDRSPARSLKPELFAGINRRRKTHLGDAALFNFRRKRHLDAASPHDVRRILPAADGVKRKLPRPSQAEPVADSASHRNRHWLIASSPEHRSPTHRTLVSPCHWCGAAMPMPQAGTAWESQTKQSSERIL